MSDAPTSDAALTGWLDAARSGGFPAPSRADRWQALRAGVVNLWEFERAEYWFAHGWAQLTGRNESGKSTLMALTTLIPWLGGTNSSNIDTLGRAGKRFRYYVEPTGTDGDRRPAEAAANRGWLWVEYGRLEDGQARYFTTLLFAEARNASSAVDLTWCTMDGAARVREHLDLAPHRSVASWKDIAVPGFRAHTSATQYREYVAEHLLGSNADRLEAVGNMLRVTRTPKLGAQLQIGFVQDHLRDALPELNRTEVNALATGWDQLDQIRADLASTAQAVATVGRLRKNAWMPWAQAALRHRADAAAAAQTDFDGVTRVETKAKATLATRQDDEAQLTAAAQAERVKADSTRAAADELQASARYQDAHGRAQSLEHYRAERDRLVRQVAEREEDLASASARVQDASQEAAASAARWAQASAARDESRDAFADTARYINLTVPATGFDADVAEQTIRDLREAIITAEALADGVVNADHAAVVADTSATNDEDRAARDQQQAEAAWAAAESAHGAVAHGLPVWADALHPSMAPGVVDAWVDALPRTVPADGALPGLGLKEAIRAAWFDPARAQVERQVGESARALAHAQAEVERCAQAIEALSAQTMPPFPAPVTWARRERPSGPGGAPLWALLDVQPGLSEAHLAGIEAALAAVGLLDAWVTPDGVFSASRDGDDVVAIVSAATAGPNLAGVLSVSDDAGDLARVARNVLAGVAFAAYGALPRGGVAVAPDGSWRASGIAGRAKPARGTAEWIGQSARAAQRRRKIQELADEKAQWQEQAAKAESRHTAASAALDYLRREFSRCPTDDALRQALALAHERDGVAQVSSAQAEAAQAEAARLRAAAEDAHAALLTFCTTHRLPADVAGLRGVRERVAEASGRLDRYRRAVEAMTQAGLARDGDQKRLEAAEEQRGVYLARRDQTSRELADAEATLGAIAATVDADDQSVLDELTRLRAQEKQAIRRGDELAGELRAIGEQVGEARAALAATEERRAEATARRDDAFTRFRHLVDVGLAGEIGLEVPSPTSSAVERVREQVAETRRLVRPRNWPDGSDEADDRETFVRRREGELVERAQEARIPLEAGGRTLRVVRGEDGLPHLEIVVDSSGAALGPREAEVRLSQVHTELEIVYNQRVTRTLDDLLGSTFLEHLRDRVGDAYNLVARINVVLSRHPVVTTQTSLGIALEPTTQADKVMIDAIRGPSLANPEVAAQVRANLRQRVEEAKQSAEADGEADWRDRLAGQLDYRRWLDVRLRRKIGRDGRWAPLTSQTFAEMSGGARAVMLMLPLVSTLAALYEDMRGTPRPLWLDEAFDGLDAANRTMIMGLFQEFDLDVLLAGPSRLVNVTTVPAAAIYQVIRAPAPMPGADLALELWAGGDLIQVDLPVTLPQGGGEEPGEGVVAGDTLV